MEADAARGRQICSQYLHDLAYFAECPRRILGTPRLLLLKKDLSIVRVNSFRTRERFQKYRVSDAFGPGGTRHHRSYPKKKRAEVCPPYNPFSKILPKPRIPISWFVWTSRARP